MLIQNSKYKGSSVLYLPCFSHASSTEFFNSDIKAEFQTYFFPYFVLLLKILMEGMQNTSFLLKSKLSICTWLYSASRPGYFLFRKREVRFSKCGYDIVTSLRVLGYFVFTGICSTPARWTTLLSNNKSLIMNLLIEVLHDIIMALLMAVDPISI